MFLRRLLTYIFIFFACLASYGQVNQVLWGKGKALYANPIATIDSLTYGQLLYGDTLYIIFDRESKRIVYDTIHIHMPGIVFHDTIYTTDTIYLESGRRIGLFSVGPNQYVTFSQGNLQYTQSTDTWQFANEQWECIGAGNIKEGALADKIDLFGWSANNTTAPWGISLSTNNSDYAGEFVDWGENIINSDVPNTWRTLTNAEWEYVLNGRDNASQLRCRAQVDHVNGFVFLPDEWVCPDGIELNLEQPTTKVFTRDEWSKMENAGAVFLPAAGRIDNKKLVNFDDHGNYWSSTRINDQWVDYLAFTFSSNKLYVDHQRPIYLGRSVRLVRDTIVPKPEYVDLGLSVKWATFNVGASKPEDYGDYFAWGETEPKETYTWATYKWGTSGKLTKYNTTDGKTILDPEDDAAYVNWGDKWRMPTDTERDELVENCTWTWTTQNSVNGYKVTGPNGNSIFLPAGGYKGSGPDYPVGEDGLYWLGNVYKNSYAYLFTIQHEVTPPSTEGKQGTRCFGFMIRPIYDDRPPKRIGVFSVAADKQVSFSQGNLQYTQSTDEWRFAREQYEYIGAANIKDGALADKIDLFGWSANNSTAPFGISTSTNVADYAGDFVDWGVNTIQGDAPNTWRTLSADEWEYVFEKRPNALQLRSKGSIDGHRGHILLPDDWVLPEGVQFVAEPNNLTMALDINSYTQAEWSIMEEAGAVFLPAAGRRDGTTVGYLVEYCGVWSSSSTTNTNAFHTYYNYESQIIAHHWTSATSRINGRAVRLVHDTIVPPPAPCETFKVNGVTFNMMCVEGGTFMMGEGRSGAHQVTLSDYDIGETEVTQGLWKAVMGSIPDGQEYEGDEYPVAFVSLADCRVFVERLSQMTGKFFRIPTEAEWEYAARGGKHSKGYIYAGSDSIDEVAWYKDNMTEYQPHAVKQLKPNELGTYDMTGNLCEWVSDWYAPYNKYPQTNPTGAAVHSQAGRPVSYRGGCWTYAATSCLSIERHSFSNRGANGIGFRLAMSDEEPFRAVYLNDTTRFYLRPVKKGTFMMGSREDDPIVNQNLAAKADELPQHKVTLDSDYWVAEYELTQALWTAVMGTDVHDMHAALSNSRPEIAPVWVGPAYPMYYVYTADVFEFTRRLSKMTGLNFRLPTEAEWEYAARGAHLSHGYLYAGSNDVDSVAWYAGSNSGLQPVGLKKPNELGIYDLSGNVLERCIDYLEYHQPYDPKDSINPRGKLLQSGNRAYRGGAHTMHKDSVRVTHRAPQTPTYSSQNVGTRLVVNDEHHFQTFNVGSVWFDMIFVKGGTFQMGATEEQGSEAAANEFPVHEVTLSDYYIGQIEVTQRLWQTVMGSSNNPSTIKDSNKPVNNVTWEECQVFVEKLSQMTGYYFRLPTEAEWEFAARGGNKSKGYKYAGSDNVSDVAWYTNNSGGTTHTFATKQPNELGIYDMSGNVWEWCYDWCGPYSAEAQVDPTGPETGEYHMYRGGGWKYFANTTRVAYRRRTYQGYDPTSLGLRLAMSKNAMIPLPEPDPKPGRRIGVFSVAKDKQVSFSQGNLQYTQSKNQWRFAENQYDYIGEENVKDGKIANRIDLFGWSGKDSNAPWGISNSTNTADYAGEFVDWGANVIGGDVANTWRTLSKEEWDYIVKGRRNAEQLHSKCCINNVKGLLLLPDNWVSIEGISIEKVADADTLPSDVNVFTSEQWKQMEAAGAVFLPAAGSHIKPTIKHTNHFGGYCSSTKKDVYNSYILAFHVCPTSYTEYSNNKYGRSVRLVHDTIVPETIPAPCLVVKVNDTLSINMMCVEGGTFMMGAMEGDTQANDNEKPAHEVTLSDYYMSDVQVSQALWEYVMGTTLDEEVERQNGDKNIGKGPNYPMYSIDWFLANEFAAKLSQMTGLQFSLPTEAEWEYAARGGQLSRGYKFAGSNNLDEVAWWGDTKGLVHPSAQKKPNELGIYDMCGNICEWTLDGYSDYTSEAQTNPLVPRVDYVVQRSMSSHGTWKEADHRVTFRYKKDPKVARTRVGFRLVLHDTVSVLPEPEYVDLGLSVKWATFNVGATSPEDYGDYFAWGETEPKDKYSWATYKWCQGTANTFTKYCSNSQYGNADYKTILDPEDDAAIVHWGSDWRMPTRDEWLELKQKCSWKKIIINGITGYQVTAKNGNSIFLPRAGLRMNDILYANDSVGYYASSNHLPEFSHEDYASYMLMYDNTISKSSTVRYYGLPIRPVYDDRPPKRIGVFSVAADKQVSFSQGNLQYTQSTDEWRFAREQYAYIGEENIKDGKLTNRIDLFGWSANNSTAPFGISTSTNATDYAGDFVDWGVNTIQGDAPNTWRTLSADEWEYVFKKRKNASDLYGVAQVAGVNGMIILPDDWEASNGIVFKSGLHSSQVDNYSVYQSFTYDQWLAMENAGAVFLPALGYRDGTNVEKCNTSGYYWSNTTSDEKTAYRMYFYSYFLNPNDVHSIYRGRSVRLVHDTIVPETIPDPCLVVKVNDTLSINMMCVEGGTFTMGDDNISIASPAHQVTLSDYYIGQTEVTQTLWKAVMGNIPTGNKNPSYPVGYVTYADCQNFIAKLNNLTGLHFQLPTEAEWEYAAMGGNKSHGYIYSGSNTIDDVAWYDQNSENKLHNVGAKQPNELGIYDMSGNAWEWCADYHGKYTAENQINPQGPATGTDRVLRSGSFRTTADRCTNKHRQARDADYPDSHITLRLVLHDTTPEPPKRIGVFSVGAGKKVSFSQGNLQYIQSTKTWQFARNQYDYLGEDNLNDSQLANRIDLFGWSASGTNAPFGVSTSTDAADYAGEFVDWGVNTISFDAPGTWRTLSADEWEYLFENRASATQLYGVAQVAGINGMIILPDDWVAPDGITFQPGCHKSDLAFAQHQTFTEQQWLLMETAGAIFLPAAGIVYNSIITAPNAGAHYQSSDKGSDNTNYWFGFRSSYYTIQNSETCTRRSVRLVHDTIVPKPEPEYVDLGLSVKWATFNVGATSPEDYGDYFAWGETEPKDEYSWATYKWCDGTDTHITKYNTSDGKITLELEDDAAHVNWGSNWRMPRKDELKELIDSCQWERATLNDVVGNKITGPNGNSIFIPAAGSYNSFDDQLNSAGTSGWLYSSTKASNTYASEVNMGVGKATQTHCSKCLGLTIRPVYDEIPDPCLVVKVNDTLSINMMCVEGGTMYIGRGDTVNRPYRQRPLRQVTISEFYLGQTEVTQELWMAIMGENHSLYQCDTCLCHPVDSVSIDEVLLFIERLNSLTGYNFRLPTEAEWEYAARGGLRSKGYAYAGSDNVNEVAWCRVSENQGGTTHPVAQKRPNELGLYDMHGNLWEFVHDKFVDDINIYPSVNPTGPEGMKGSATGCGSAYYSALMPENTWGWVGTGGGRSEWFGFRLALSDQDPFAAITIGKYRFHMMYVKGGTFMMGSDAPDAEKDEKPVHEVTLSDYYIGQTEVTQKLWKLVMGNNNNPSANQGDELPVTNISRADCQTFVEKLSELTGLRFRLPTEAEWEYAARGGQNSKGYVYAGSNDINEVAWYPSNCQKPQAVGQKKPNELGIYDMSGNVYEFCYDWYGAYPAEPQTNPQGPSAASNGYRSCRGGCWQKQNKGDDASYCRIVNRGHDIKGNERIGLRIVLEK